MTCASDIVPTNLKRASILTLPNEVLLRIFDEVYYASCDIRLDEESTTKLADASLFPQCLIKVCKAWKKLIRSVPRFATRIMVFVDEPISFDELRGRFEDSKTLFIKVFAIRRQYPDTYDPFEKGVTRDVVKALSPHIERCKVVVFDLLQNSSLPHMTQFSGQAPKLRTLRMQCRRSVANENTQLVSQHELLTQPSPFICPHLQYLDMHGHMFVEAVHIPQWQRSIRALSRKQLTISHLRNVPAEEFDLRKLMLTLSEIHHLTKLKLLDVELDNTTCISEASPGPIFIQNFEFEDLSRDFFTGFFAAYENAIDVSDTVIKNCQLGRVDYFPSWSLKFENIDAEEDLVEFISHWDGFYLLFKNCPGIDDRLLERLSTLPPPGKIFYAPTFRHLEISGSSSASNFSVEALKFLVTARKEHADKYDSMVSTSPLPLYAVHISGQRLPELSNENLIWFRANLESFLWDIVIPPSPVIEGDCSSWDFTDFDDESLNALIPSSSFPTLLLPPSSPSLPLPPPPTLAERPNSASDVPADPDLSPPSSLGYDLPDDYCKMDWSRPAGLYL